MRPCVTIEDFASVHLAIERMRDAGQECIPVTHDGKLVGVLTQKSIVRILGESIERTEAVGALVELLPSILNKTTGSEALRQLESNSTLVVVDEHDVVCGLLNPSCFIGTVMEPERPPMVGGMATPFGVYLTTGTVRGGKSGWYLVSTGVFLMTFLGIGYELIERATASLPVAWQLGGLTPILARLFMLLAFRAFPIAGYHAAEHQVVHALERDEALTPEVVARMPRVHPRCGTNIAVAILMFMAIWHTSWGPDEELRLLAGFFITFFLWRSVGSFVQYWFTTKKPNAKQIASGILAGQELLDQYAVAANRTAGPFLRIYNSGMLHVMAGSFAALGIALAIGHAFGVRFLSF